MREAKRTPEGAALTQLIPELLRLNSRLLAAGDRLVDGLGLTSARWQVLGAVLSADRAQPVAWLARDLGAARQNVQRIVNDLAREALVAFAPNPHHRRAPLVAATEKGRRAYEGALHRQAPCVNTLAAGLRVEDIERTQGLVRALRQKLEIETDADEQA